MIVSFVLFLYIQNCLKYSLMKNPYSFLFNTNNDVNYDQPHNYEILMI